MAPSASHIFLRYTRLVHLYLGIFTAPALIFFAFTGALQTFSLHETTRGSSYKPPAWAVTLAQLHKKQTPVVPVRKAAPTSASPGEKPTPKSSDPAPTPPPDTRVHHPLPMKIFFLIVSIGLFVSTISGIYMSYKYVRNRVMVTVLLVFGTLIPLVLAFV
jgi:hypothetical protein